ncbi:MAG: hypothetical protein ACFB00_10470 [Parvularculaceae bacterium]
MKKIATLFAAAAALLGVCRAQPDAGTQSPPTLELAARGAVRALTLQSFEGAPRLGEPAFGARDGSTRRTYARRNAQLAAYTALIRYRLDPSLLEDLADADGGAPPDPARARRQRLGAQLAAGLMTEDALTRYACPEGDGRCPFATQIAKAGGGGINLPWGGPGANEFRRRAAYADFLENALPDIRAAAAAAPTKAVSVEIVALPPYDFEKGGFPIALFPGSRGGFFPVNAEEYTQSLMTSPPLLKMAPGPAEALVERAAAVSRVIYAVVDLTFTAPPADAPQPDHPTAPSARVGKRVRFFEDRMLAKPIGEISI